MVYKIILGDCKTELDKLNSENFLKKIHLTFLDPPFNQNKNYKMHNDSMAPERYWQWITQILKKIFSLTTSGGAIYFMQREKNAEFVLRALRAAGWTFQNLLIWKKLTSAVPNKYRYGKQYQIIVFATKGTKPRVFNRLRIDLPLPAHYKTPRETGVYVNDIWNDIRELTSGYLAGDDVIRTSNGNLFTKEGARFHKQQTPIKLLTRLILASSLPNDTILDPFAGTGTTAVVTEQLSRNSISIELNPENVQVIKLRLNLKRSSDDISRFLDYYRFTKDLDSILSKMPPKHVSKKSIKSIEDFM